MTNLKQSNSGENQKASLFAKDTDKIIEAQQGPHYFFVCLHDDVNPGADTFIHQLWNQDRSEPITHPAKYDSMSDCQPSAHQKKARQMDVKYWQTI